MSMLGSQANELRNRAKVLRQGDWSDGADDAALMEQAADTIEGLRDSLNEVAGRWADAQIDAEVYARENMLLKAHNGTRWHELFGTPERAARTLFASTPDCRSCAIRGQFRCDRDECVMYDHDALLDWLKEDEE